jgi:23S rRNA-/tRNA-specific pseudouridylate synthase
LGPGVKFLRSDANGLVALGKPAGVLSHPNDSKDHSRSLLVADYELAAECYAWTIPAVSASSVSGKVASTAKKLWLLNRLDSATSGVILAAATEALATEIRAMFQRRHVHKVYQALVFGLLPSTHQVWHDRLAVQKAGGKIRVEAAGNIPAESHVRVLKSKRGDIPLTLLQLEPKTGRSHQLRVQCAKRHLPIVGDATYGNFRANREFAKTTGNARLFLHSSETSFRYSLGGKEFHFAARAELPEEFEAAFQQGK